MVAVPEESHVCMTWASIIASTLGLLASLVSYLSSKKQFDAGQAVTVAKAFAAANEEVAKALTAAQAVEARHANDATDGAFDPDFRRKDEQ